MCINADAQPVSTTRPDGDVITSGYDLAGRLQTMSIPRGSFGYTYDGPTGKLSNVTGPGGSSRSYGYQGSLLASLGSGGPATGIITWTHDNSYRTTARTVNGANGIAFGYDADDLTTAVGSLTLGRNAQNGLLTGTTLGSVTDSVSYSTFAEVSGYAASTGASQLYSETYVRDNLGRIAQRTEVLQGTTTVWGYAYDLGGRLSSVTRNGATFESYTYDTNDNRLTKTTTSGTATSVLDNQDRLLSSSGLGGTQSWTYDANGDLLTRANASGTTVFDYDTTGQLLSVTKPGGQVVSYELDAGNKRAVKRANGVVQRKWLYAGGLLPVAEYDANDNLVSVFNGGFMVKNGTTYRLLRDHLGSVRLVVDASTGVVAQRLSYDAWGNVLEDTNPGFQPFGFANGLYDPDTGLVRFGARDYDPGLGRWTCKDPLGILVSRSTYAYCNGDPVNYKDPTGLKETPSAAAEARAQQAYTDARWWLRTLGINDLEGDQAPKVVLKWNDRGGASYNSNTNTITLNKRMFAAEEYCRQSRAVLALGELLNEIYHARHRKDPRTKEDEIRSNNFEVFYLRRVQGFFMTDSSDNSTEVVSTIETKIEQVRNSEEWEIMDLPTDLEVGNTTKYPAVPR